MRARAGGGHFAGILRQTDTYLAVRHGRLKLLETQRAECAWNASGTRGLLHSLTFCATCRILGAIALDKRIVLVPFGLFSYILPANAGIAQLVERNLAKVDVAGSNPVSRSVPGYRDRGRSVIAPKVPERTLPLYISAPPPPIPPGGGVLFLMEGGDGVWERSPRWCVGTIGLRFSLATYPSG